MHACMHAYVERTYVCMYVYACMHVLHIRMYVCMSVRMYACMDGWMDGRVCVCACLNRPTARWTDDYVCTYVSMPIVFVCIYIFMCVCVHRGIDNCECVSVWCLCLAQVHPKVYVGITV